MYSGLFSGDTACVYIGFSIAILQYTWKIRLLTFLTPVLNKKVLKKDKLALQ